MNKHLNLTKETYFNQVEMHDETLAQDHPSKVRQSIHNFIVYKISHNKESRQSSKL
jgi:hypothetical protein